MLIEPPSVLAITAGRFRVIDGRIAKSQHVIIPDQALQLPAFLNGEFVDITYRLNSFIVHLGEAPSSGHYLAIMFDAAAGEFHYSDDNVPMRVLMERDLEKFHRNSYVFLYQRDGQE